MNELNENTVVEVEEGYEVYEKPSVGEVVKAGALLGLAGYGLFKLIKGVVVPTVGKVVNHFKHRNDNKPIDVTDSDNTAA